MPHICLVTLDSPIIDCHDRIRTAVMRLWHARPHIVPVDPAHLAVFLLVCEVWWRGVAVVMSTAGRRHAACEQEGRHRVAPLRGQVQRRHASRICGPRLRTRSQKRLNGTGLPASCTVMEGGPACAHVRQTSV